MQKAIHMKVELVSFFFKFSLIKGKFSFKLDSEESPYQIYGRIPMPTRGYIAPPRMYVGDWD